MESNELESAVKAAMATAFIESLPEDTKKDILAASVERTLTDLCNSYTMKSEIGEKLKGCMQVYIDEYLEDPEVRDRLKELAHEAVDVVHEAVLSSMIRDVQRGMKSKYSDFVKDMNER